MKTRNAAAEAIRGIKEGRVGVCHLDRKTEQFGREPVLAPAHRLAGPQQFHRFARPHRPVSEQAADNASFHYPPPCDEPPGSQEVQHDVVVVSRIKRNILPPGLGHGPDHVEGLITVERGDFDGHHIFQLGKPAPKAVG